jgi:hypothetical protein
MRCPSRTRGTDPRSNLFSRGPLELGQSHRAPAVAGTSWPGKAPRTSDLNLLVSLTWASALSPHMLALALHWPAPGSCCPVVAAGEPTLSLPPDVWMT